MIISESLNIGQITFIARASILVLYYGGLILLAAIIFASVPRLASLRTHDVLNRTVGKTSSMAQSLKWITAIVLGRINDPELSPTLAIAVLLLALYPLFVAVTDIGLLGFHACLVPVDTVQLAPGAINDRASALAAVQGCMIPTIDPSTVKAFRCDSSHVVYENENITYGTCTAWKNGTYADRDLFLRINTTDSDRLSLRMLKMGSNETGPLYLNGALIGPGTSLLRNATIEKGIAIIPDDTGVRAIVGVPALERERRVVIDKTMAFEVDMGCISLGVIGAIDEDLSPMRTELFSTDWTQRYWGPENMRDTLLRYGGLFRDRYRSYFQGPETNGWLLPINKSSVILPSSIPQVQVAIFTEPFKDFATELDQNCTRDFEGLLEIGNPYSNISENSPTQMCTAIRLAGPISNIDTSSLFYCVVSQQINMVSAVVERDRAGQVTASISHLRSDLHWTYTSWYGIKEFMGDRAWVFFSPLLRYALSNSASGPARHYVPTYKSLGSSTFRYPGPGSPGIAIRSIAGTIMSILRDPVAFGFLRNIQLGDVAFNNTGDHVLRWAGQVSGSFIQQSLALNGWAAEDSPRMAVSSTGDAGGIVGTCYHLPYAASFIPLLIAGSLAIVWGTWARLRLGNKPLAIIEASLGGLGALRASGEGTDGRDDVLMLWAKEPEPHLEALAIGRPVDIDGDPSAVGYLKLGTKFLERGPAPTT